MQKSKISKKKKTPREKMGKVQKVTDENTWMTNMWRQTLGNANQNKIPLYPLDWQQLKNVTANAGKM